MPRGHKKQKDKEHGSSSKKPSTEPAANNHDQHVLAHQLYADRIPVSDIAKVLGNEQGPMDISQLEQMIKDVERLSVTQSSEQESRQGSAEFETYDPLAFQEANKKAMMQANWVRAVKDGDEPHLKYDRLVNDGLFKLMTFTPPGDFFRAPVDDFVLADQTEAEAVGRAARTEEEKEAFRRAYGEDEDPGDYEKYILS